MSDLADLYQQIVLDHGTSPRNFGEMDDADRDAEGFNPLCGDRVHVLLKMNNGSIEHAKFTGKACAICTASASMMTQEIAGIDARRAAELIEEFRNALSADASNQDELPMRLKALLGVRRFPMRVKCATLPWHTLAAALKQETKPVTTE